MNTLPNCKYCGKFINPNDNNVVVRDIYGDWGVDETIFFHKECEPKIIGTTQPKNDYIEKV